MYMKDKNIFKAVIIGLTGLSMVILSCTKETGNEGSGNGPAPVFPDPVVNYAVDTLETIAPIVFTPDYDWEITIPVEARQWFWFKDGSMNVRRITGKASKDPVSVYVCATDYQDFDSNHSCEVTLTMAGESKVVATYMLRAKSRALSVYAAVREEGGYVYPSEASSSADLDWSAEDADFRAPIKVEANCEWDVEKPEWLEINVPETTVGIVELVMTGESLLDVSGKVIFKSGDEVLGTLNVTLPSCNDISVYSAKISDGELEYGEDGYAYTEEAVSELALVWLGGDFRIPMKVDSKCNWTLDCPDWISVEIDGEKTTGELHLTVLGVPSEYPLEETSGKIVFIKDGTELKELDVVFPGCRDILQYDIDMSLTSLDYSYDCMVKTSVGFEDVDISGNVMSVHDARIFAVETTGGQLVENPDWFTITVSGWNTADGADVLQTRTMDFDVVENKGDARSAVLFLLPPVVTASVDELFNDDLSVKEEYAGFAVPVTQASKNYTDYLLVAEADDPDFTFARADEQKTSELSALFGETDFVYVMTYEDMYASDQAALSAVIPYTSVKVFGQEDVTVDKSGDESYWLEYMNYTESDNYGVIRMYLDMELPAESSVGYVVFYDSSDAVLAIVECISPVKEEVITPDPGEDDDAIKDEHGNRYVLNDSYFLNKAAAAAEGATLYELRSGPFYDQYREFGCPILILEYTSADSEIELKLPSEVAYWSVYPSTYSTYVSVNGDIVSETQGILSRAVSRIKIKMSEAVYTDRELLEPVGDKYAGLKVALHKDKSTQDPSIVIFCRLDMEN